MNEGLIIFLPGLFLFVGGLLFVVINLLISRILHPRVQTPEKPTIYECGELPVGQAWVQFNHRFYLIALIFVVFDVEVVFLFPWILAFKDFGWIGIVDLIVFLALLVIGLVYAWGKEALVWDKPRPRYTSASDKIKETWSDEHHVEVA